MRELLNPKFTGGLPIQSVGFFVRTSEAHQILEFKFLGKVASLACLVFFMNAQHLVAMWPSLFSITFDLVLKNLIFVVGFLNIFNFLTFARYSAHLLLDLVVDLVVYDRPDCFLRFFVIYVLRSTRLNTLCLIRTQISEVMPLLTVSSLFFGFGWLEREVFDMFGIFFINHPDLRKILNNYCFSGFPLRRDFPLTGPLLGCVMGSVRGAVEIVYSLKMCWDVRGFVGATLKTTAPTAGRQYNLIA